MGAVFFYHLTRSPLEALLPVLLGKAQKAGWRVAVRGTSEERLAWLDEKLWLGRDEEFLAHGLEGGEFDADQPILLTTRTGAKNGAACIMAIDGAEVAADEVAAMQRTCVIFDGNDPQSLELARGHWKQLTEAGCSAQYWSQDGGKWVMKVETDA
ncbi:DNA polymerase III subunit chi [Rhodobacteraceae bacterium R_SAG10]|jgi:DNA polymerase-3 subunit chi|nr:DNA polymerase III subunit chi [Rhodobacteraceae bacterium R_SAG10]